jgi:hypothetical protein
MLASHFPRAAIFEVSAEPAPGSAWFDHVTAADDRDTANLEIAYNGARTAKRAWMAELHGARFRAGVRRRSLAVELDRFSPLRAQDIEIAHLKATLSPDDEGPFLSVVNAVSSDAVPVQPFSIEGAIGAGEVIINLRAEGDPEVLDEETSAALAAAAGHAGLQVAVQHAEHFRPGRPVPTHRVVFNR